jgi:tetratricopeptide (TPR) repeat protein
VKLCRNRGRLFWAGLLACTLFSCFDRPPAAAETNVQTTARSRDDKGAMVNLAIQVAQQLQAQQQSSLRAINETKQQTADSVASLRRLTLLVGASLALGILALVLYARKLVRLLQQRAPVDGFSVAHRGAHPAQALARKGGAMEQLHRFEEALSYYEQAIILDATLTEAYVGKGRVLNQLERYDEALACYERASKLQPPVDIPRMEAHRSPRAAA